MLRQLCQDMTGLTEEAIQQLEALQAQLPLMAELSRADVFIDCPLPDGRAVVVAHARPSTAGSAYRENVTGQFATPEKEPAVFHALALQAPVRDIKAITQENRTVLQDVVPIFTPGQQCVALLIKEQDISGDLLREKKWQTLSRTYEGEDLSLRSAAAPPCNDLALREVHHRVKNNLQLVASILSLQARRCGNDFTKKILLENVGRVLSIASIPDILTQNKEGFRQIDSLVLLEQLRKHLQALTPAGKQIAIQVTGPSVPLSADAAASVSLVVNELITNALEHAFQDQSSGSVQVCFCAGQRYHTITVSDDGCGFDPAAPRTGHLGLNIVEATVRDKLRGHLTIHSGPGGSRVSFDFKTE